MTKKKEAAAQEAPTRAKRVNWRIVLALVVLAAALASPLWGPPVLRQLAFFRVRKVEVLGARYTPVSDIMSRLQLDTSQSVWDPVAPLEKRVALHPQLRGVEITRKLPGTLVVQIHEREPVALVSRPEGLTAVDETGRLLPLDPSATPVDVPVVTTTPRDTGVYHLLGAMQREAPDLYSKLSTVTRTGRDELVFRIGDVLVRAMTSVTLARLSDIEPVERDLMQHQRKAVELDLRYRDQVIARVQ